MLLAKQHDTYIYIYIWYTTYYLASPNGISFNLSKVFIYHYLFPFFSLEFLLYAKLVMITVSEIRLKLTVL